jgi:hypothetical protein
MRRGMRVAFGLVLLLCILIGRGYAFMSQASFGELPECARLDAISQSPHYEDGAFRNTEPLPLIKGNGGLVGALINYVFSSTDGQMPARPMPSVEHRSAGARQEYGYRCLARPFFLLCAARRWASLDTIPCSAPFASPVFIANRAFEGTNL